jgi:hypothetical protein
MAVGIFLFGQWMTHSGRKCLCRAIQNKAKVEVRSRQVVLLLEKTPYYIDVDDREKKRMIDVEIHCFWSSIGLAYSYFIIALRIVWWHKTFFSLPSREL